MAEVYLQEGEATVVVFDLRGFSSLAAQLSPLDLGAVLSRFYDHCEHHVLASQGRVLKIMGDMVTSAWLGADVDDHRRLAVGAISAIVRAQPAWQKENAGFGIPHLEYSVAAASGRVLAGQIGTDRMRNFDVLGEPSSIALKLTPLATARGVSNLVTAEVLMSPAGRLPGVELEGVEIGGRPLRLYRVD
jgi:adenylate cyclase